MANPYPYLTFHTDSTSLVQFNIGSAAAPACISASETMNKGFVDAAAQALIKKNMIELGFVYTGWGPRGELLHVWYSRYAHSGI
jgi:hypothetical protein